MSQSPSQIIATRDFLDHIQSLYPTNNLKSASEVETILDNKWYLVAAVAFSAGNSPEEVPRVFEYELQRLSEAHARLYTDPDRAREDQLTLARRFRDSLFLAGVSSGYARVSDNC
jgi:hypothetical protein